MKENWPEIWKRGGNILGNVQYNRLKPIAERSSSIARTETEERAIRLREAWAARHSQDFRLAGVVAQVKWLVVGSRGLTHMRAVIREAKQKISKKQFRSEEQRSDFWSSWIQKKVEPTTEQFQRISKRYLDGAKGRVLSRINQIVNEARNVQPEEVRSLSWMQLLRSPQEVQIIKDTIGRFYTDTWILTGNETIDEIYEMLGRARPDDFRYGDRNITVEFVEEFAKQMEKTTRDRLRKTIREGIEEGLSNREIAAQIDRDEYLPFSESRARLIAQTETTSAINRATNDAYNKIEKEEGIQILKQWISSNDDRVRPDHKRLDGQTVAAGEEFKIGKYSGSAPASFGEPEMDINCRCTIAPIVIDD